MKDFDAEIARRLHSLAGQGLYRELRRIHSPAGTKIKVEGRELLNFSSNDYLGLANHPLLKEAAIRATRDFGAGSGASRLICGSLAVHHELEETLAAFKQAEAALVFSSGYAAAVGTIGALAGKEDIIILDKLSHACLVDAARLSGAKLRVFAHNDLDDLEAILLWAAARPVPDGAETRPHVLIVTESVFSMDGDFAPLPELVQLKQKYGAWLMVDEAHATGIFGGQGRGLAEETNVSAQIEIQMGTLGKALGASGGYIAGSRRLVDYLINRARTFIFSTAPTPASAGAARAALELAQSPEGLARRTKLFGLVEALKTNLSLAGWPMVKNRSSIIPLIVGGEKAAVDCAVALREAGIFIPAIRYPTVARGQARLRLTLTAGHEPEDLVRLENELKKISQSRAPVAHE